MAGYDDDDRGGQFAATPADEYHTYDATDEGPRRRGPLLFLGAIVVIAAFAGVVFLAYQQGMKQGAKSGPPLIQADRTPFKMAPEDPGGQKFPHRDKRIYDKISGAEALDNGIERLLPRSEEPIDIARVPNRVPETSKNYVETLPPALEIPSSVGSLVVGGQQRAVSTSRSQKPVPMPAAKPRRLVPPSSTDVSKSKTVTASTVPARVVSQPARAPKAVTSGEYVIQIAAFRDVATANAEFASLRAKHSDLLDGMRPDLQRADLGDKGIYYRLRMGFFASKEKASQTCAQLKTRGQGCLVRKR
ncbi:MAG: SPOR domain-containing protein [Rhodobiaceae bacterium]|nr:SPOR domain-containing protein [Rhodobiaceae bacterium]